MTGLISNREAFDNGIAKEQFSQLLLLLVNHGIKKEDAAQLCLTMAEKVRSTQVAPMLHPYVDLTALHYEDMANRMLGGSFLPRDTTD